MPSHSHGKDIGLPTESYSYYTPRTYILTLHTPSEKADVDVQFNPTSPSPVPAKNTIVPARKASSGSESTCVSERVWELLSLLGKWAYPQLRSCLGAIDRLICRMYFILLVHIIEHMVSTPGKRTNEWPLTSIQCYNIHHTSYIIHHTYTTYQRLWRCTCWTGVEWASEQESKWYMLSLPCECRSHHSSMWGMRESRDPWVGS